ncbi:MAG: plastocyanin/azurin family copper-binding protein [Acidimicrobiia bacterium]
MRKSPILLGLVLSLAVACGGGGGGDADHEIVIEEFTYSPAQLKVKRGDTVRFVNRDAFEHTVTSGETSGPENVPDGLFDESLPDKGSAAVVTFDEAGTFTFYCQQHNAMDGEITVS